MSVFSSTGSHSLQDESEPVYSVHQDHIATIVLNRPEKLNAITSSMWKRLHQAITTLSGDDSLRCIVIRSSCAKAFSPGCDIDEFAKCRSDKSQAQAYGRLMHDTLNAFWHCPIPVVAEIRGICIGAGLEIASTCDFRIASETCRLGAPVKNLGLVMAYPELEPLLQLAGKDVVLEMLLEGKFSMRTKPCKNGCSPVSCLTISLPIPSPGQFQISYPAHRLPHAGTKNSSDG